MKINKDQLNEVIIAKKLRLKETDGQLRGAIDITSFNRAENYSPDEAKLKKINKYSLVEQTSDSVITASLNASNTQVDRGDEKFADKAINTFVKLYPDKPVLLDHNWKA